MTEWTYDDFIAAMTTLMAVKGKQTQPGMSLGTEVRELIPDIDDWDELGVLPARIILRLAAYNDLSGDTTMLWSAYPDRARALLKRGPRR